MKKIAFCAISFAFCFSLRAQKPAAVSDSSEGKMLQQVVVKAYEQNRKLAEVPASIGIVTQSQLKRFGDFSILPAVNMIPGVRMEERSPASYRLNVRGSTLRSPFGVRDVKVYWNDIPLTDPGGNTYLNELGFYNFQSLEIIKGPAGGLYGAGIGGATLIHSLPAVFKPEVGLDYSAGSFATQSINAAVRWGDSTHQNNFTYSHQSSDGYRVQSQMRRDVGTYETVLKAGARQTLHAFMMYSDLYYQTPGGLTLKQYNADPQAARPPSGTTPGAVQNKAAIYQKTFIGGFTNDYQISDSWKNTTSVYGAYTEFDNPGIRVYEKRKEPHFGGRTVFDYTKQYPGATLQVDLGAEAQKGFFNTKDYKNKGGLTDSLQTDDDINLWQYMIFAQGDLKLANGWIVTAGISMNKSSVGFTRLTTLPPVLQTRTFENELAPRLAVLKKIFTSFSLYASVQRGFSNPTVSELLKSSGTIGNNLQPENGLDEEAGIRGSLLHDKLYIDVDAFFFQLQNTIVQRIDSNGVSYSVNAGSTLQNGLEAYLAYQLIDQPHQSFSNLRVWVSETWFDFHYADFKQVNANYSGNRLPGVPTQSVVAGLDLVTRIGIYANLTYNYTGGMWLNDANTDYAGSYNLFGTRIGYRKVLSRRLQLDLHAGVDNLFNTRYSLGNDFNAAAGRYYNAAPGINYYAGLSLHCRIQ